MALGGGSRLRPYLGLQLQPDEEFHRQRKHRLRLAAVHHWCLNTPGPPKVVQDVSLTILGGVTQYTAPFIADDFDTARHLDHITVEVEKDRARYAFIASLDSLQDDWTLGLTRVPKWCQQAAVALVGTLVHHHRMSSLIRAPLPPRLVLHAANVLRTTDIHAWGCDAATIWWLPPEGGATRLTVAHFRDGGPTYEDALFRLGDIPEPLLLMLPTDLAAALRREVDSCEGLRVGWGAITDGTLLALLHRDVADRCQWGPLVPQLAGHHTYMTTPARRKMTSSHPSTTTGSSSTTRGRRSGRRPSAGTTDAASAPAY